TRFSWAAPRSISASMWLRRRCRRRCCCSFQHSAGLAHGAGGGASESWQRKGSLRLRVTRWNVERAIPSHPPAERGQRRQKKRQSRRDWSIGEREGVDLGGQHRMDEDLVEGVEHVGLDHDRGEQRGAELARGGGKVMREVGKRDQRA